jgi:glycosyltransferase involved in cell wall biosynthesis
VAGEGGRYFDSVAGLEALLGELLADPAALAEMRAASLVRFEAALTWPKILGEYEQLLQRWLPRQPGGSP